MSETAMAALRRCELCPRRCAADRLRGETGFCGAGAAATVALAAQHHGEEPCISGSRGSGTVFFSRCNLRCVYCQNHEISWGDTGKDLSATELAEVFLQRQTAGAHNLNLVSPTPYIPVIAAALRQAKNQGLKIPVVYNSNAYENVAALRLLDGLVDIYLPDLKYFTEEAASRYSGVKNYFAVAAAVVLEMHRQVGNLTFSEEGLAVRGLLIRHLVLPGQRDAACRILEWIHSNLPNETFVSIMSQYVPLWQARRHPEINRRLSPVEYQAVLDYFDKTGLLNGYMQDLAAATEEYVPMFDLSGLNAEP
ncbi:radical SAM protein [Pelotomaculum isophthalicicum JI]|uniref:Radical SAM protein n=1 Tax=Pelotomaculum isophthalicicum JI TaxID=947010 RepID=A0A9X4H9C9_9FIRM|nr:radical SAM protein [Pelotomaculum isophthalicicum]MDF9410024.1 radical SAM protein [Pelotomaculum isophthalicicum JI]